MNVKDTFLMLKDEENVGEGGISRKCHVPNKQVASPLVSAVQKGKCKHFFIQVRT